MCLQLAFAAQQRQEVARRKDKRLLQRDVKGAQYAGYGGLRAACGNRRGRLLCLGPRWIQRRARRFVLCARSVGDALDTSGGMRSAPPASPQQDGQPIPVAERRRTRVAWPQNRMARICSRVRNAGSWAGTVSTSSGLQMRARTNASRRSRQQVAFRPAAPSRGERLT